MGLRPRDDYYEKLLTEFRPLFREAVKLEIQMGNNITIEDARAQGISTKDSGLTVSKRDLDLFTRKLELNIRGATRDMSKRISNTVMENISLRGSNKDLAKELKQLFQEDNADFMNFKNRFETIARTESTSVLATSGFNKAQKLGATKKYLSVILDTKTSAICENMLLDFGEPEEAININTPFVVEVNGKIISEMTTPFHPNCRTLPLYVFED